MSSRLVEVGAGDEPSKTGLMGSMVKLAGVGQESVEHVGTAPDGDGGAWSLDRTIYKKKGCWSKDSGWPDRGQASKIPVKGAVKLLLKYPYRDACHRAVIRVPD